MARYLIIYLYINLKDGELNLFKLKFSLGCSEAQTGEFLGKEQE